ncbi:MAG: hypothetical protein O7D86_12135 [Proteobacteria bacterium]|nr:hypothetical protein [Pseudomonadota bacterium]
MNYIRTFSGSMMAITPKTNTLIAVEKQTVVVKPSKKSLKDSTSKSK